MLNRCNILFNLRGNTLENIRINDIIWKLHENDKKTVFFIGDKYKSSENGRVSKKITKILELSSWFIANNSSEQKVFTIFAKA